MSHEPTLIEAITLFGKKSQIDICIEEMSELTKELLKDRRGYDNRQAIIEEIADVFITLSQVCHIFDVQQHELDLMKEYKITRLQKFIKLNKKKIDNNLIV